MLSQYNPIDIEILLRENQTVSPFPPVGDRAAWEKIRERIGEEQTAGLLQKAEQAACQPIPFLPASLWLECKRTGERRGYEDPAYLRRTMMRDLTIGECLEGQGRFIDPLMDVLWAICEESSWAYPAHHTDLADMERPYIDLGAAMTAFELAEVSILVGAVLPAEVSRRICYEVNQRVMAPYLARHDFWWLYSHRGREVNNWTAVCNAGVMAAAIYLEEDPARLADILAKGALSLEDYLVTFDEDGGSTEGPGYWTYGFGYYTLIAHLVEHRTGGKMRLMDGDQLRKIAAFPLRTMLSAAPTGQGMYVNFSDAPRYAEFIPAMLVYLAERAELPDLIQLAKEQPRDARPELSWLLRSLCWNLPQPDGARFIPARHDWYNGMMWMLSRFNPQDPDALTLAAKGGHNEEMHNHNDVGNFLIHYRQESLIDDVGCGRYTLQYFSAQRYEHFAASSLGHSVPVPNQQLQSPGRQHAAHLLEHTSGETCDILRLDLKDAYPSEAGLRSLERRLVFHREAPSGWVELEDSFAFQDGPAPFESAITTFSKVEPGENAILIKGLRGELRVGYDPQAVSAQVELYRDVDLSDGRMDVYRVVFSPLETLAEGKIRLEIVPL